MLKNNQTYEIMTPESVGISQSSLVWESIGPPCVPRKIHELGYELGDNQMQEAFVRFKDLADRKKHVFDDDLIALVDDEVAKGVDAIKLVSLRVISGSEGPQSADLELENYGEKHACTKHGDGPVDATFNAIKALFEHDACCNYTRCMR
ncbi:MAG: hypothetical protein CM15mP21_0420 [Hyphomicrobiales bacterium]|nr:MAG: hypothetical protein CM15mP21_0420 [Hyphomicrobiales bacterium]